MDVECETNEDKRSPIDREEESKKRMKNQSTAKTDDRESNRPKQTSISDWFRTGRERGTTASESSSPKNQWFEFPEKFEMTEMQIDCSSSLKWCRNFISADEGSALFDHLMQVLNFEHTEIKMYGKPVHLPRLQSWFADEGLVVPELFQKQKQHVWTLPMRIIKIQLEKLLDVKFDYCLVNFYRNGNDYINFHADNEARDVIASLSLGATRRFLVRHLSAFGKTQTRRGKPLSTPERTDYEFPLSSGFLLAMLGNTQLYWKHSIPKEKKITAPRINLTFRTIQKQ